MDVRILKGTNQIGGCITEISSKSAKIIIDFGMDLDNNEDPVNPMIEGLTTGEKIYDAVFITHNHFDHIGLISFILPDIPIYVEQTSKKILEILYDFMNKSLNINTINLFDKESIYIKDMKITPYIVDHSAYNSLMLLVESDNKRILHTGDYRNHGYKGYKFDNMLKSIGKIDCLITEGTSLSREDNQPMSERELSIRAESIISKYNQVFIMQSGTNIDRITSMFKAAIKTNKLFIEDIFVANLTAITNSNIPNPLTFSNVYVYIPQNRYISHNQAFASKYLNQFSHKNAVNLMFKNDYVMNVRINMLKDLITFKKRGLITNACLIYSMWDGYKEKKEFNDFLNEIKNMGIDIVDLHTSGHASISTIKKVVDTLNPNIIIPIHTINKNKASELFNNAILVVDKEQIII